MLKRKASTGDPRRGDGQRDRESASPTDNGMTVSRLPSEDSKSPRNNSQHIKESNSPTRQTLLLSPRRRMRSSAYKTGRDVRTDSTTVNGRDEADVNISETVVKRIFTFDKDVLKAVRKFTRAKSNGSAVTVKRELLTAEQFKMLLNRDEWLSSDHINAYLSLLNDNHRKVHAFPTYFYSRMVMDGCYDYEAVRRWTKKIIIFDKHLVFVPVNHESHWLLAVIWLSKRKIEIWDSVGESHLRSVGRFIKRYLRDEWEARSKDKVEWKDFSLENRFPPKDRALQTDGSSCGAYVCLFARLLAENISSNNEISIDNVIDTFVDKISGQDDDAAAAKFRNVMAVELWLKGALSSNVSTKDADNVEAMDVD